MEEKITIKVNIAERVYPINIDRAEEEKFRKAVKLISDKVLQYRQKGFSERDEQDFLAMVALHYTLGYIELDEAKKKASENNHLSNICDKIDAYLQK